MNQNMRVTFLINSIINSAADMYSEYPMKAAKARRQVDQYKRELEELISSIANPTTTNES